MPSHMFLPPSEVARLFDRAQVLPHRAPRSIAQRATITPKVSCTPYARRNVRRRKKECLSLLQECAVEWANSPVIYLSTDAAESKTSLLQSFINGNGKIVPLVQRPASNSAEKWDTLLYMNGLEGDPQVSLHVFGSSVLIVCYYD
ncbi:hypothetical protein ACS0TY_003416 [Phlomoides rotata]